MSDKEQDLTAGDEAVVTDKQDKVAAGAAVVDRDREPFAGWAYLAVLFAIFLGMALVAYASDGDSSGGNVDTATATTEAMAELSPVDLTYTIDGNSVVLTGEVPDTGAKNQLVAQAAEVYGAANVTDELTINENTTLKNGTIKIVGNASEGDSKPEALLAAANGFGESTASLDVNFAEVASNPVDVEIAVGAGTVTLMGVVPDEASRQQMIDHSEATYGAANVDATGLTVDDGTTWENASVRITGLADPGDNRHKDLAGLLERDNPGLVVDDTVEVDASADALGRAQEELAARLALDPIQFETGSASISSTSDQTLQDVAAILSSVPDVPVEIVGHTDSQGSSSSNQALSDARASAVRDRLTELGVDAGQMTSRGAGEDEPIADNSTDEGRQQNRRIAFIFEGASTDG